MPSVAYSASASGTYPSGNYFQARRAGSAGQDRQADLQRAGRFRWWPGRCGTRFPAGQRAGLLWELDLIGTLPDSVQQTIYFSAGLVDGAQEPEAARHLLKFLTSPAGGWHRARDGSGPGQPPRWTPSDAACSDAQTRQFA